MAGRGRPVREPTLEERAKVSALAKSGASKRAIAAALDRSIPNLRKYFSAELECKIIPPAAAPPIHITDEMRADVALMAACNEPSASIAKAIGVTEDELAQFFTDELDVGIARYRLKILKQMDKLAVGGNLTATKQLAALMAPATDAAPAAAPLGKKAAAKAEAEAAASLGGKFATRSAPRLAAVNGKPIDKGS